MTATMVGSVAVPRPVFAKQRRAGSPGGQQAAEAQRTEEPTA